MRAPRMLMVWAGKIEAPTLVASRTALPPEGAELARGGPSRRSSAPTLVASGTALPLGEVELASPACFSWRSFARLIPGRPEGSAAEGRFTAECSRRNLPS